VVVPARLGLVPGYAAYLETCQLLGILMRKHEDCENKCQRDENGVCMFHCELVEHEEYENWMRNMSREERLGWMKARDQDVD